VRGHGRQRRNRSRVWRNRVWHSGSRSSGRRSDWNRCGGRGDGRRRHGRTRQRRRPWIRSVDRRCPAAWRIASRGKCGRRVRIGPHATGRDEHQSSQRPTAKPCQAIRIPPGTIPFCGVRGAKGDCPLLRRRCSDRRYVTQRNAGAQPERRATQSRAGPRTGRGHDLPRFERCGTLEFSLQAADAPGTVPFFSAPIHCIKRTTRNARVLPQRNARVAKTPHCECRPSRCRALESLPAANSAFSLCLWGEGVPAVSGCNHNTWWRRAGGAQPLVENWPKKG